MKATVAEACNVAELMARWYGMPSFLPPTVGGRTYQKSMRRTVLYLLFAFLVAGAAGAHPNPNPQKRVTHSFKNVDLIYVLKLLAHEIGVKSYFGPTVQGTVTIELVDVPAEEAIRQVLALQENEYDFLILNGPPPYLTLVVAPPDKLAELREPKSKYTHIAYQRMEYLLEQAPSTKVLDFLKGRYPDVEFTPHPTMNGFYARGSREDLLQIKHELATLDRVP